MNIQVIGIWDGSNLHQVISILVNHNEELRVRVQGRKLIIKDPAINYYRCIPAGERIEIPKYESRINPPIQTSPPKESRLRQRESLFFADRSLMQGE